MQCDVLAFHVCRHGEVLAVPCDALIVATSACFCRLKPQCVRNGHYVPVLVVKIEGLGSGLVTEHETPALVEVVDNATAVGNRIESCNRSVCCYGRDGSEEKGYYC